MLSIKNWQDDRARWEAAGVELPKNDVAAAKRAGAEQPRWIHVGAGNLYRTFHAAVAQDLLDADKLDRGVVVADMRHPFAIDDVYRPFNDDVLMVTMNEDGTLGKRVLASTAASLFANPQAPEDWARMKGYFASPELQLVTVTITEKGYTPAPEDIAGDPVVPVSAMGLFASLLLERFQAGAAPIALVTTDNFSQNGRRFRESVLAVVNGWLANGHVGQDFADYVSDEARVSFPWSMIDRITPQPLAGRVRQARRRGLRGRGTHPSAGRRHGVRLLREHGARALPGHRG